MRPASLKHLLTKPALLIAAGLVLLGAATGRGAPAIPGGLASAEGEAGAPCRATKPAFDALCRCLGAALVSEDEGGFAHVGLDAAFQPSDVALPGVCCLRVDRGFCEKRTPRTRLRQCVVGPSPPVVVVSGA